jgi:long-chain fatty acid transport protein
MKRPQLTLFTLSILIVSTGSNAAGFQLNSQSATGVGRAFSGDAVIADNASVLSRNPAAMTMFDNKALSFGASYATLDASVTDVSSTYGSYGSEDNAASNKVIPNFYYIHPLNDKIAIGVGLFSNFGTGTDISDLKENDAAVTPIDLFGITELATMNLNASISYRINPKFSVGAGIDIIYGEGDLQRNGEVYDGYEITAVDVDATGWALGGIIGGVYEINDKHRLGMSYRLSPTFVADGTVNFSGNAYDEVDIPLPDIFQIAGYHEISQQWALHYTAQYTTWSDFNAITVTGNGNSTTTLKDYQWKDSWLLSVGATYTLNQKWILRVGYMHDQSVVDEIGSLSILDSDRNWYTAGTTYQLNNNSSIDFGLAVIRGADVTVVENSAIVGDVTGYTNSNAIYYSMQYNYAI